MVCLCRWHTNVAFQFIRHKLHKSNSHFEHVGCAIQFIIYPITRYDTNLYLRSVCCNLCHNLKGYIMCNVNVFPLKVNKYCENKLPRFSCCWNIMYLIQTRILVIKNIIEYILSINKTEITQYTLCLLYITILNSIFIVQNYQCLLNN